MARPLQALSSKHVKMPQGKGVAHPTIDGDKPTIHQWTRKKHSGGSSGQLSYLRASCCAAFDLFVWTLASGMASAAAPALLQELRLPASRV